MDCLHSHCPLDLINTLSQPILNHRLQNFNKRSLEVTSTEKSRYYWQGQCSQFGTKPARIVPSVDINLDTGLEVVPDAPSRIGNHPMIVFDKDDGGVSGEKDSAHAGDDMDMGVGG